jgi:predicted dehydrogenase
MNKPLSRRDFLQTTVGVAGALAAANTVLLDPHPAFASPRPVPPSDRIRLGIIGVGMQGSPLLTTAITLPGVECVAACDLYDGRHTLAKEITSNPSLPTTRRYQELLENKDIDCLIVAVPDHWHKQIVVDAVNAGKDVYCEKPMSHTAAEGFDMAAAQQKTGRIVQIGSQRVSSTVYGKAKELISQGAIGDLCLVEGMLGRNDPTGAWEYPPPTDLSAQTLDWDAWQGTAPKRPFDGLLFARWRCWKEYGTGVAGDLLVHLISGITFALNLNEPPKRALALGGILRWKDGRNMPDVHASLFEYGNLPIYARLNLGTEMPEVVRIQGAKGYLEITENSVTHVPQPGVDTSPSYYALNSFPRAMREEYLKKWHADHDPAPGQEPLATATTYRGISYDEIRPHLHTFFEAVRTRKPVTEDAVFGNHAALACHMANESYFRKSAVTFDSATRTIKG